MRENRFVGHPNEMVSPQCNRCRHFIVMKMACAAFPGGVPDEILLNRHDHRKPYPDDNGIRFESEDGAPVQESWFARNLAKAAGIPDPDDEPRT